MGRNRDKACGWVKALDRDEFRRSKNEEARYRQRLSRPAWPVEDWAMQDNEIAAAASRKGTP